MTSRRFHSWIGEGGITDLVTSFNKPAEIPGDSFPQLCIVSDRQTGRM